MAVKLDGFSCLVGVIPPEYRVGVLLVDLVRLGGHGVVIGIEARGFDVVVRLAACGVWLCKSSGAFMLLQSALFICLSELHKVKLIFDKMKCHFDIDDA